MYWLLYKSFIRKIQLKRKEKKLNQLKEILEFYKVRQHISIGNGHSIIERDIVDVLCFNKPIKFE